MSPLSLTLFQRLDDEQVRWRKFNGGWSVADLRRMYAVSHVSTFSHALSTA